MLLLCNAPDAADRYTGGPMSISRVVLLAGALVVLFGSWNLVSAQSAADADFDHSGKVDFTDFLEFISAFGSAQSKYDLNVSGRVDFEDFLVFIGLFGQTVEGPTYEPGDLVTVRLPGTDVFMEFASIPSGTFTMGSPSSESGRGSTEGPQHEVTISEGFQLGKYEVTQGQWEAVMGTTPWVGQSYVREEPANPAVYVSWNDAQAFVQELNAASGDSLYRLPTEAEWEYACRAETSTRWSFGDDETELGDYAWYRENAWNVGEQYAHEVGVKLPNLWGLHDMHGNVYEWCQDWYGSYTSEAQEDPLGPSSGSSRVERGGSFGIGAQFTRSAARNDGYAPDGRGPDFGFRLLRRVE